MWRSPIYYLLQNKGAQMERFELCERVGLVPYKGEVAVDKCAIKGTFIRAEDVELLLSDGVTVYGCYRADKSENIWSDCQSTDDETIDTHQATLIAVKPIAKPVTADELLREYAESICPSTHDGWCKRVREYLGRKA